MSIEIQADYADLIHVDANQVATFDGILQSYAVQFPTVEIEELAIRAASAARDVVPTASEAAKAIAEMRLPGYCYLAFCGVGGVAQYVKVGMSTHPEQRVYSLGTANPLDCLWVYTAKLRSRKSAYAAEQTLIRKMADHRRRGEWFEVDSLDAAGAENVAREMSVMLSEASPEPVDFSLLGFSYGQAAA